MFKILFLLAIVTGIGWYVLITATVKPIEQKLEQRAETMIALISSNR